MIADFRNTVTVITHELFAPSCIIELEDRAGNMVRVPHVCALCDAKLEYKHDGKLHYSGGWRLARQREDDGRIRWGMARCRCQVGDLTRAPNPVGTVPYDYPSNAVMHQVRLLQIEPAEALDNRTVHPALQPEIDAWNRRFKLTMTMPEYDDSVPF